MHREKRENKYEIKKCKSGRVESRFALFASRIMQTGTRHVYSYKYLSMLSGRGRAAYDADDDDEKNCLVIQLNFFFHVLPVCEFQLNYDQFCRYLSFDSRAECKFSGC